MLGFSGKAKDMSKMVFDPELRQNFVNQSASFVKEHNFDGMDINWRWPACHNDVSCFKKIIFNGKNNLLMFRLTLAIAMPRKQINLVLPN